MCDDVPSYLLNRSLGLGTSKRGFILASKPTADTQPPSFLSFNIASEDTTLYQKDVIGHYGCINAIEFSPNEELVVSGGDDRRVVIWATDELLYNREPKMRGRMARKHYSNIFALGFDPDSKVVYSAGNDSYFVSSDILTGEQTYGMQGTHAVHDISVNKRSGEVVVTRCGGRDAIYFHDPRSNRPSATITFHAKYPRAQLFSAQFNPDPSSSLIGLCGEGFGVRFIDRRNLPKPLFSTNPNDESAMYGGWNRNGTKFAHLVSGKSPRIYDFKECHIYETSATYEKATGRPLAYKNMHTVKSLEWMDDDWLITGSDDFNIYAWNTRNIPNSKRRPVETKSDSTFHFVEKINSQKVPKACLVGHRSIVNHVRFSSRYQFLVSSGVEKIIKVWNTRQFPNSFDKPRLRKKGTTDTVGEETVRRRGNGDRTRKKKTDESGRMLRYFDSLLSMGEGELSASDDEPDSLSSADSSDPSDDESSSGGRGGVNRLVEDTDSRDGVQRVPDMRVIIHGDRSIIIDGVGEDREDEDDGLNYFAFESDSSDGEEVDVTMDSHESDSEEEEREEGTVGERLPLRRIRSIRSFFVRMNALLSSSSDSEDEEIGSRNNQ